MKCQEIRQPWTANFNVHEQQPSLSEDKPTRNDPANLPLEMIALSPDIKWTYPCFDEFMDETELTLLVKIQSEHFFVREGRKYFAIQDRDKFEIFHVCEYEEGDPWNPLKTLTFVFLDKPWQRLSPIDLRADELDIIKLKQIKWEEVKDCRRQSIGNKYLTAAYYDSLLREFKLKLKNIPRRYEQEPRMSE